MNSCALCLDEYEVTDIMQQRVAIVLFARIGVVFKRELRRVEIH
jgi:predicted ATPase